MNDEKTSTQRRGYTIFIEGELVNLCIPSEEAIEIDGWVDWFNDIKNLSSTGHGLFPNYRQNQMKLLDEVRSREKIVLLICEKKYNIAFGVVSLQKIDLIAKTAEIAINIGKAEVANMPSFSALEAMALITEHGFSVMGLDRIFAGQAYPNLIGWNKLLELIGFKTEGIARKSFKRGHAVCDTVLIACVYQDFVKLTALRGSLWGGVQAIKKCLRSQPTQSYAQKIDELMTALESEHFAYIFCE